MASKLDFPEMTDAHWRSMEARWISMDLTDDADELIDTTAYLTKCRKFREQSIDWLIKDNQKKELKELSRNYGTERKVRKLKSLLTVWRQKRDEKKMSIEDKDITVPSISNLQVLFSKRHMERCYNPPILTVPRKTSSSIRSSSTVLKTPIISTQTIIGIQTPKPQDHPITIPVKTPKPLQVSIER
ncbi:hypothetical protein BC829DRAFT_419283 [Chytridium lagenaria]|nr:hypothetical protein BC829DRAFT_419283 [Chytridium lagenaria]